MPFDSYVQVAPDSTGKKVDMDQVSTAAGTTIYRQKAAIVGDVQDSILQIAETQRQALSVLRAILATLSTTGNVRIQEEDFSTLQAGTNFDV